jgi:hypothetical protein
MNLGNTYAIMVRTLCVKRMHAAMVWSTNGQRISKSGTVRHRELFSGVSSDQLHMFFSSLNTSPTMELTLERFYFFTPFD